MYIVKRLISRQTFLNPPRINGRSLYSTTTSSSSSTETPNPSYRLFSGEEQSSTAANEFLSRFVWIMRKKVSEAYPDCDKETVTGMLRVIADQVAAEIGGGGGKEDSSPPPEFSEELWRTVREVSESVMSEMKKSAKKEKMKRFLQCSEVKEMTKFAVEVGVRGDMLRDMRFKWACDKLEEAEFQEGLDRLAGAGEEEEEEDDGDSGEEEREEAMNSIPVRSGKISYKIYGLDLSDPKWAEAMERVREAGEKFWPDGAKPISGECDVVNKKIMSLKKGDDPAPLLAEWAELLQPGRRDWVVLLTRLKKKNPHLYFKVAELVLSEESFETDIRDYSNLIDAFSKANRLKDAERIVQKMNEKGIAADLTTATILVHMYCKVGNLARAKEAYNTLKIHGYQPDANIYNSMVKAFIKAGKPKEAFTLTREMDTRNIKPSDETYLGLLRLFSKNGDTANAESVYSQMLFSGAISKFETCKALVEVYSEAGQLRKARDHFDNILRLGLTPDDECTASMVAAYGEKNMLSEALALLSKLEKDGFQHGVATYSVLVDWFGKLLLVDEAEHLLGKISELGEAPPLKLQLGLCDMYSRTGSKKKALQAFSVLEAKNGELRSGDFERIINALADGKFAKQAHKMLQLMETRGFTVPEQLRVIVSQISGDKDQL